MEEKHIIMNFTVPPSLEDIEVMAEEALEQLPEELASYCDNLNIRIEDLAGDAEVEDLDLEDAFELLVIYKNGREIAPGIEQTTAHEDDVLILYRRPILDYWCETEENLSLIIRQMIVEEVGRNFDFSDTEIDEMVQRHYQGLLD